MIRQSDIEACKALVEGFESLIRRYEKNTPPVVIEELSRRLQSLSEYARRVLLDELDDEGYVKDTVKF